jgi:hypothetical protein
MADSGNIVSPLSADQPVSLLKDLKDIWTKSSTLASCVSIPVLGVNAVVNNLIDPYKKIGEILVLTAPLCCSVTIIAMLFMRGSFKGQSDWYAFYSICAALIVPYIVALFFGAASANIEKTFVTVDHWTGYFPHVMIGKFAMGILFYYFFAYGLARTTSSVICGCFIAWVFQYKLLPQIRQRLEM